MYSAIRFAAMGVLATQVAARCNNDCNNHGICNAGSTCECERGFVGNDCAERLCYFGEAFIDSPLGDINSNQDLDVNQQIHFHYTNGLVGEKYPVSYGLSRSDNTIEWDEGHFYRECSNKGTCNRATGECECFPGFEGAGCTRLVCPDDCSGHGQCVASPYTNNHYTAWDYTHTQKCVCDPGYTGPDCSLRKCPSGVDPIANVYINTETIWKIEFKQWNSTLYDDTTESYLPNGKVDWTMTFTDQMGDQWTTSAVTSYYQADCGGSATTDPTASCASSPFHSDPSVYGDVDVVDGSAVQSAVYADSDFTFHESFIAEQVNKSVQALPADFGRDSYVWVTHAVYHTDNYLVYPSYGVPSTDGAGNAVATQADACSNPAADCNNKDSFSQGASIAVNDAKFRFPYFNNFEDTTAFSSAEYTNCNFNSLCIFIRLPSAVGTQQLAVSFKYKTEIIDSSDNYLGEYSESVGSSEDGTIVEVNEVGSDRYWSVNTDGTPRIDYNSDANMHTCSRRGLCDYETGLCDCFSGYSGYKCNQRSVLGF